MKKLLLLVVVALMQVTCMSQQAATLLPIKTKGKWGLITTNGEVRIAPQYEQIGTFAHGLLTMQKNGLFHLVDTTGKELFPEGYEDILILSNNFIALKKEHYALATYDGKVLTHFSFTFVQEITPNTFSLKNQDGSYDVLDIKTGKLLFTSVSEVLPLEYRSVGVKKNTMVALIDSSGKILLPWTKGEDIFCSAGVPIVKTNNGYQFYSPKGTFQKDENSWEHYSIVSKDFAVVWNHPAKKSLYSTSNCKHIYTKPFTTATDMGCSMVRIEQKDKLGMLDTTGKVVLDFQYDNIIFRKDSCFQYFKENKTGILTAVGNPITTTDYDYIDEFNENGIATLHNEHRWGCIDRTGKILVPLKYNYIEVTKESWKCYQNPEMDLYVLDKPTVVDEILHFNNVHTIRVMDVKNRNNYAFRNKLDAPEASTLNRTKSKFNNYALLYSPVKYNASTKIKCGFPSNFRNVDFLFGVYHIPTKKIIATKKYWDIQIDELEDQQCARIILPGDKQALLSRSGNLITQLVATKNGKPASQPITYIGPFNNGLARVNIGGKFVAGTDIVDPHRASFSFHKASCEGGYWGYIDGNGFIRKVIDLSYASDFYKGKAIVCFQGKYGVLDSTFTFIIEAKYDYITYLENSNKEYFKLINYKTQWGLLSDKGAVLVPAQYEKIGAYHDNRIAIQQNNYYELFDFNGNKVSSNRYDFIGAFHCGLAVYKEKGKFGYIDSMGNVRIPAVYSNANEFKEGYASVQVKGVWGFIDTEGKTLLPMQYQKTKAFCNGVAAVYRHKKWSYISADGKKLSSMKFTKVYDFNNQGLAIAAKGKKHFVIQKSNGKKLTGGKYKKIFEFSEGIARAKNFKNKYGAIDTTGKIILPFQYSNLGDFHNNRALAKASDGKYGYLDKTNKWAIAPIYKKGVEFSENKATVCEDRTSFVIDTDGKYLFPLPVQQFGKYSEGRLLIKGTYYDAFGKSSGTDFKKATPFANGVALVKVDDKKGEHQLINLKYALLASFAYISSINQHTASYTTKYVYGVADSTGKILLNPDYQELEFSKDGFFKVTKLDTIGYMRKNGEWMWNVFGGNGLVRK